MSVYSIYFVLSIMKYYLYRHIRSDKNEVFYIGISKKKDDARSYREEYKRAFDFSQRGKYWKNIKNKTDVLVEIIYECDSEWEIKAKEIEFIKFYGRKDKRTGTLVNTTDGGDGRLNPSEESIINNGKNLSIYHELAKKKVYQYTLEGEFVREWNSITEAAISINDKTTSGIIQCCKGGCRFYKGFLWRYSKIDNIEINKSLKLRKYTKIYQYDQNGDFIREWENGIELEKFYNNKNIFGNIQRLLRGKYNPTRSVIGCRWSFEKVEKLPEVIPIKTSNKKIGQYNIETGELIQIFDSLIEAAKSINGSFKAISLCALGKNKTSSGFKWKYL